MLCLLELFNCPHSNCYHVLFRSECQKLVAQTIEKFGNLDYLVNNAGTTKYAFDHSDMGALDTDDFLNIYKTNVIGPYNLIKHAKPFLMTTESPGIVNVASIAAVTGQFRPHPPRQMHTQT
jgi:3-oxoacyl-[acyl-carrier protein] reductase